MAQQVPQKEEELSVIEIAAGEANNVPELRAAVQSLALEVLKLKKELKELKLLKDERVS